MDKAGTARTSVATPSPGEAALQQAFAELRSAGSFAGSQVSVSQGQSQAQPAPKTVAQMLGEIIWLMTQSPRHKAIPLGDLEWLVMPAVLLRQFRMFYRGEQPAGVALWAQVDDFVAKRIDAGDNRLTAVEWKSGTQTRIVELVAPFGGETEMREQIDKQ